MYHVFNNEHVRFLTTFSIRLYTVNPFKLTPFIFNVSYMQSGLMSINFNVFVMNHLLVIKQQKEE